MDTERFKDFDAILAAKREKLGKAPHFTLGGIDFQCVPTPKATAIADLTAAGDADISALIAYLRTLVVASQRDEFDRVLDDDEAIVDLDLLGDLVSWLAEGYAGRPTD